MVFTNIDLYKEDGKEEGNFAIRVPTEIEEKPAIYNIHCQHIS